MKGCGGGGAGALVVGAAQGGCSECVSFYQVKEKQGGGRRKIYLLPSENFDPGVVNLSKESSQLNRKHEEERGDGRWGGWRGWDVLGGGGSGGAISSTISKEALFRDGEQGVWGVGGEGCPRHVYNPETDPSQPANLPPAPPPTPSLHPPKKQKIKTIK